MSLSHICFIVPNYPTSDDPVYTFVRELVCSIADLGIKCTVIAPQSMTNILLKNKKKRPYYWQDTSKKNNNIYIYQPSYFSLSNITCFGVSLSSALSHRAVIKAFNKINIRPDILYAHFWHSGVTAGYIGKKYNIPVFVATGESEIWTKKLFKEKMINDNLEKVCGAICVSTKNMQESIDLKLINKEKTIVIPNAIDNNVFYSINKNKAREKLGYKIDDFIIAYIGAFSHRKGVLRLANAIHEIDDDLKSIYIGSGDLEPKGKGILFKGRLPHNQIVNYLNAADIFVLPTLAEGCCNAIIEAMACGLPIISSNLSFNDDILDDRNSIRINSKSIEQIANAIQYLKNNPKKRKKMGKASLEKAKELDIRNRAMKILDFIQKNRYPC